MKNISGKTARCLLCASVLLTLLLLLTGFDVSRRVIVDCDGQRREIRTNLEQPEQILKDAGIRLEPGDSWQLQGFNKNIQDGSVISVRRGVPFTVTAGGKSKSCKSSKATVGEALKEQGYSFRKKRLYPPAHTPLTAGAAIHILNKGESLVEQEAETPPETEYIDDRSLAAGIEVVESQGTPGREKIVSAASKANDPAAKRELGRERLHRGDKKIVRRGVALSVKTPEGYKRYSKKLTCEATAYVATGHKTSLGLVPYEGIVAVDPDYIPYYTKMYIPGYGIAMAGDTGGDMIHHRIDLFMDSYQKAIRFGRRDVEVYILEE